MPLPWARFAQQWGGANITERRDGAIQDIEDARLEGELDPDATVSTTTRKHRDANGNKLHSTTNRVASKWGVIHDPVTGNNFNVSEADTFTYKQIPGIQRLAPSDAPRRLPPPRGPRPTRPTLSDDDGGGSPEYGFAAEDDESYIGSAAPTPPRPGRVRAIVTAPISRRKPMTYRAEARRQMLGRPLRVSRGLNPRGQDLPTRRIPSVITPPASEEDEPAPRRAPSPPRRFAQFRDASPARGPRRSARERVPVGFYDPTIGKGWSPEQMAGCGGFITSSDGFYNY